MVPEVLVAVETHFLKVKSHRPLATLWQVKQWRLHVTLISRLDGARGMAALCKTRRFVNQPGVETKGSCAGVRSEVFLPFLEVA